MRSASVTAPTSNAGEAERLDRLRLIILVPFSYQPPTCPRILRWLLLPMARWSAGRRADGNRRLARRRGSRIRSFSIGPGLWSRCGEPVEPGSYAVRSHLTGGDEVVDQVGARRGGDSHAASDGGAGPARRPAGSRYTGGRGRRRRLLARSMALRTRLDLGVPAQSAWLLVGERVPHRHQFDAPVLDRLTDFGVSDEVLVGDPVLLGPPEGLRAGGVYRGQFRSTDGAVCDQ